MRYFIKEDDIERELIDVCLNELDYNNHFNCYVTDHLHRSSERGVLNLDVLRREVKRINASATDRPQGFDDSDVNTAVAALNDIDLHSDPASLNATILSRIINGFKINVLQANGKREQRTIQYIDWGNPTSNQFDVVNQLWIQGDVYRLRPDVIIYVNGIPLITIELKDSNIPVKQAFDDNLTRYKAAIPQLMAYNAVLVASNGLHTRVGATFAKWAFFAPWFRASEDDKINKQEIENEKISLDVMARSLLKKENLLDYIHNYILFYNGSIKICAKNHQFLGVNRAVERYKYLCGSPREEDRGKMGVFWHTQGSGKSFSMVYLARLLKNRFPGNFTFLIITDREDLDSQIYRNFLHSGFMSADEDCQPKTSDRLRTMLEKEDHRILFTLIQKFRYDKRKKYPILSERDDIIVFIDEAHRTQYKSLAENLRAGLPNAKYMAFTGTPLFGSKKLTNRWFGETVSEYNFSQAVQDEATVRLTYRNHLPEVQNENPTFSADFINILQDEELDDDSRQRLEREYAKELEILRRPARLNKIADDIVEHIINRGYLGKAMVVSVDRFTAVRMYDLVTAKWQQKIAKINHELMSLNPTSAEYQTKLKIRDWMRSTDMAVVISTGQGDEERFAAEGLNLRPHIERMNDVNEEGQELQDLFRDEDNPLRVVFVCSMWLTGFDSPMVSTLYMDKPLAGQNLMQTIARANRRCSTLDVLGREKSCGQIISYCNIFGSLKKAFATYGDAQGDGDEEETDNPGTDTPGGNTPAAMTLDELYTHLRAAIAQCVEWCRGLDVDLQKILDLNKAFNQISLFDQYANILINPIERKAQFAVFDNTISQIYDECLPDIISIKEDFVMAEVIHYLRQVMDNSVDRGNLDSARRRIKDLLNQSIVPKGDGPADNREYTIKEFGEFDLSRLDIDKLRDQYGESKCKALEIADLEDFISQKLDAMLNQNSERRTFAEEFQRIIERYNAGSTESEEAFRELMELLTRMSAEQRRASEEGLTEEELEVFDILRKENLSKDDVVKVKAAARDLLSKLKSNQDQLFTTDWYKDSSKKSSFILFVRDTLDMTLPDCYDRTTFREKNELLCNQFIIRASQNGGYLFAS